MSWSNIYSDTVTLATVDGNAVNRMIVTTETNGFLPKYSVDAGATWTQSSGFPDESHSISSMSQTPWAGIVYVCYISDTQSRGIIYVSNDGGHTFTALSTPPSGPVSFTSIAVGNNGTSVVTASNDQGANTGYLYVSTDSGATWTTTSPGPVVWGNINVLSDSDPLRIYAMDMTNYIIYFSADAGATWSSITTLPATPVSYSVDPYGQVMVASCGTSGVYLSTDSGVTWAQTSAPTDSSQSYTNIIISDGGDKIVVGDSQSQSVYYSLDQGTTWKHTGAAGYKVLGFKNPSYGAEVYAGAVNDYLLSTTLEPSLKNTDWFLLGKEPFYGNNIRCSSNGQNMIALNNSNVMYSTNYGKTFANSSMPVPPLSLMKSIATTSDGSTIYLCGNDYLVYLSTDSGATFTHFNLGEWEGATSYQNMVCNSTGSIIYLTASTTGILTSTDSGATWTFDASVNVAQGIYSLICSTSGQYAYVAGVNSDTSSEILYTTADSGATWSTLTLPTSNVKSVACDGTGQYLVLSAGTNGVYRSTDYGATWTQLYMGGYGIYADFGGIASDASGINLIVTDNNGQCIFNSYDSGATWTTLKSSAANLISPFVSINSTGDFRIASSESGLITLINTYPDNADNGGWSLDHQVYRTVKIADNNLNMIAARYEPWMYSRVEVTTDGGMNWTTINSPDNIIGEPVRDVAISSDGQTMYYCAKKLYKSTDYGATFTNIYTPGNNTITSIATSSNGTYVFCTVNDYSLNTSADGGVTFNSYSTSSIIGASPCYNICCSATGQYVYSSVSFNNDPSLLIKSTDYGATFTTVQLSFSCGKTVCNRVGDILYATGMDSTVYVSTDYGATWNATALTTANINYTLTCDGPGNRAIASSTTEIYITTDLGASWTTYDLLGDYMNSGEGGNGVSISPDGTKYYISTPRGGTYYQSMGTPDVTQWTVMWPRNLSCLECSTSGQHLVGIRFGDNTFLHSKDYGLSFHPSITSVMPNGSLRTIAMSSDGSTILLNGSDNLMYKSTDYGDNFSVTGNGFSRSLALMACDTTAQYVYATNISSTGIYISNDSGANWTLGADFPYISWTSLTCNSTGQYVYAAGTDEFYANIMVYSTNYGVNWTIKHTSLDSTAQPLIYFPFDNDTVDVMGGTPTVTGSPGFVTGVVGNAAINLNNTFGSPATQYIREATNLTATSSFTVSLWFNSQGVATGQTVIFELGDSSNEAFTLCTSTDNELYVQYQMAGAAWGSQYIATSTSSDRWYHIYIVFNHGAMCYIYLDNKLAVSFLGNFDFYVDPVLLSIGCYAVHTGGAYPGYIDDFRLYNTAITPIVSIPTIFIPFDNSVVDVMGGTATAYGDPTYTYGITSGGNSINFVNNAGDYATQYVREVVGMTSAPNFTISFTFNAQSLPTTYQTFLFELGTSGAEVLSVTIAGDGQLNFQWHTSTDSWGTSELVNSISLNTWYTIRINYNSNGMCYTFVNNQEIAAITIDFSLYTPPNLLSIGAAVMDARGAFNGYLDNFRMYNNISLPEYGTYSIPTMSMASDATGQYVVSCGADALYRSSDYGKTYSAMGSNNGFNNYSFIKNDSTGSKLLVAETSTNRVYYSEDAGATWTQQGVTLNNTILSIAMSSDATFLIASSTYGRTFVNAMSSTLVRWNKDGQYRIKVSFSANNQYAVGIDDNTGNIIRSTNSGATWTNATTYPDTYVSGIVMDYTGQYVVAAMSGNGIYRSTDYGDNFTQLGSAPNYNWNCITCSFTGQYIYAGIWDNTNGYVYVSSDSGSTFTQVDPANGTLYWDSIKCSVSGQHVYAKAINANNGWTPIIYYSSNYGQTWTMISSFSSYYIDDITCDATGQYVLATCTTDGIYRSTDYGATWTRTGAFHQSPSGPYYAGIVCNASGQQILAIDDNDGLVYRSSDSGDTWTAQYLPGYYNYDGYSLAISPDGSKQLAELYEVGTFYTTGRTDNVPTPSVPCFLEGTKILCQINGQEKYVAVESIRPGTLVKTSLEGFKAVKLIGHRVVNNTGDAKRNKNDLYLCSKSKYPELTEDLTITGCHAILVSQITDAQRTGIMNTLERIFVTDRKYRLPACIDERATVVPTVGNFTVWHFALEHYDIKMNYGVYAQGLLVESSPIWHMNIKNYTLVQ